VSRRAVLAACALVVSAVVCTPAFGLEEARDTNGPEMASMRSGLDGERVTFEGEVVSEVLAGGDGHAWVNVLSDGTAIGVWLPVDLAEQIGQFGTWSRTGDVVRVTGVLNEGCDVHGGDLDVHAESLEVLSRGGEIERPIAIWKIAVGVLGIAVALLGWWRMRRVEEGDEE
jgi:hypothetical protein